MLTSFVPHNATDFADGISVHSSLVPHEFIQTSRPVKQFS